ncbi:MAG: ABC transporter permease subunit [Thermodesulfobacteriota bacterium]
MGGLEIEAGGSEKAETAAAETKGGVSPVEGRTAPTKAGGFPRRWLTIRDKPGPMENGLLGLAALLLALVIWQIITAGPPEERLIGSLTLPSPGETIASLPSLWFDRALARSAIWSLGRVLGGFLLAAAVGVPLGVAAGAFKRLNAFLRPLSIFGRNVPVAALIPLTLIWFGLGETQKVMFIFFACVAFIFFDSACAVDAVPDTYLDTAYTLGARFVPREGAILAVMTAAAYTAVLAVLYLTLSEAQGWVDRVTGTLMIASLGFVLGFVLWWPILAFQAVRKVLFPLSLPDIINSLRLLFGLAFGYIMLAEVINAEAGLGSIIIVSQRRGPREHIYLALIIIALLAFGIDRLVLYLQRRLFPYRRPSES